MKEIFLYTKKIKLEFNEQGVSLFNLQELISEIERDYRIADVSPSVATFENYQYITVRVIPKNEQNKKPLGFSVSG